MLWIAAAPAAMPQARASDGPAPRAKASTIDARNASPAPTVLRTGPCSAFMRVTPFGVASSAPSAPRVTTTIPAAPDRTSWSASASWDAASGNVLPTIYSNSRRLGLIR